MTVPKYSPRELIHNIRFVLFNPQTWMQFLNFLRYMYYWQDVYSNVKEDYSILKNERLGIIYHSPINYRRLIVCEWPGWERFYKFPFSLKNKTVLDIGAGCGETALFYKTLGAHKIICIEQNRKLMPFLEENRKDNHANLEIINEAFTLKHLDKLDFDASKMDIDYGEKVFLESPRKISFPMVAEIHGPELQQAFLSRGLRLRERPRDTTHVIMDNFGG